jgi:hypothetical protein
MFTGYVVVAQKRLADVYMSTSLGEHGGEGVGYVNCGAGDYII